MNSRRYFLAALAAPLISFNLAAADIYTDPPAPALAAGRLSNGQNRVTFGPYPSADVFKMLTKTNLDGAWAENSSGLFSNLTWTSSPTASNAFHRLQVTPLSSNVLLGITILDKLNYGPTPELLDRLATNSPDVYINEQLNPETIVEHAAVAAPAIATI